MTSLRVYLPDVDPFDSDGYPVAWQMIKHEIREAAGHRCVRCGHPYRTGQHGSGEWSPCDERCTHLGPFRHQLTDGTWVDHPGDEVSPYLLVRSGARVEARSRILTVHHLTGDKADCRWFNLASLCQRCHLRVQGRTKMDQVYPFEHSDWFKPYAAGYYAATYLGEDLTREQTEARLDELLALERVA